MSHRPLLLAACWLAAVASVALTRAANGQDVERDWTPEQRAVIDAASTGPVGIETDFERWERGFHARWTYWRLGAEEVRPRDAHMDLVRGVVESHRVTAFVLTPVDVIVRGDVALLRYSAEETLIAADGSERVLRYFGADMFIRERGVWQVLATNLTYPER